jgi:hypothetical protein
MRYYLAVLFLALFYSVDAQGYEEFIVAKVKSGDVHRCFALPKFIPNTENVVFMDSDLIPGDTLKLAYSKLTVKGYYFSWTTKEGMEYEKFVSGNTIDAYFFQALTYALRSKKPVYLQNFECVDGMGNKRLLKVKYILKFNL